MTRQSVWLAVIVCVILPIMTDALASEWRQGNRIKVRPGGFDGHSLITMEIADGGDTMVRHEAKTTDGVTSVTLLLVEGQALAVTGDSLPAGKEMELLDTAGLHVQLIEEILSRAFPGGPASVNGHEKIALHEKKEAIRIGTTGAKGYFSAPWTVTGEAKLLTRHKVGFDFQLSFKREGSTGDQSKKSNQQNMERLKFAGVWERDTPPPRLDDRLPLHNWKVYLLGTRTDQDHPQYTTVLTEGYPTLAALRRAISAQAAPTPP